MRKTIIIIAALTSLLAVSCTGKLFLDSETSVTNEYLLSSVDGLQREVVGLYAYERDNFAGVKDSDSPIPYIPVMLDYSTDILLFRAGNGADVARMNTMTSTSGTVAAFWKVMYGIIGKANEIIAAGKELGMDDEEVRYAVAEARLFRAKSYFLLWQRFGRLYLNTEPTTVKNLERTYAPSSTEAVLGLVKEDLDYAASVLGWTVPRISDKDMHGRFTRAVALHLRAQVAMWEKDWDTAIEKCEEIFTEGSAWYGMEAKMSDVFLSGNGELRGKEVLYAYQFSTNPGGGNEVSSTGKMSGHVLHINTTAEYRSIAGCVCEAAQGGYGFGRMFPNSYLLGLYDKAKDNRYSEMFKHSYYYNDPDDSKFGQVIPRNTKMYERYLHPMSLKHADFWTNQDLPTRQSSFKDLIVYRLAETALMCSEAYFRRDGGSSKEALDYFNKTWERAGNAHFNGPLTQDILLDEYARELNFEGVRWPLLKRLGLLGERCKLHGGDTRADDPELTADYAHCRTYFEIGKHENWPIPANQILLMGGENAFPQNPGWN